MGLLLTVTEGRLVVRLEGLDRLWAFSGGVDVPLAAVSGVRAVSLREAYEKGRGLRFPGTFWPGLIRAGTYVSRGGGRSFWCVHRATIVLMIELAGQRYDRLVLEVEDPQQVSRQLTTARFR